MMAVPDSFSVMCCYGNELGMWIKSAGRNFVNKIEILSHLNFQLSSVSREYTFIFFNKVSFCSDMEF